MTYLFCCVYFSTRSATCVVIVEMETFLCLCCVYYFQGSVSHYWSDWVFCYALFYDSVVCIIFKTGCCMCSIMGQIECFVMLCLMIVLCVLFSRQCVTCVTLLVILGVLLCFVL